MGFIEDIEAYLFEHLPSSEHAFPMMPKNQELASHIQARDGYYARALKAIMEGHFDEADVLLTQAQAALKTEGARDEQGQRQIYLGHLFNACYAGRFTEAMQWADTLESLVDHDLQGLTVLGKFYFISAQYEKAESLLRREIMVTEQQGGSEEVMATRYFNLAEVYRMTRRFEEAEAFYHRSLLLYEQAMGANHPNLARILIKLAVVHRQRNGFVEVERLLSRIHAICGVGLKESHPDVSVALFLLAGWYEKVNRFDKAKRLYAQIIRTERPRLGDDHACIKKAKEGLSRCVTKG